MLFRSIFKIVPLGPVLFLLFFSAWFGYQLSTGPVEEDPIVPPPPPENQEEPPPPPEIPPEPKTPRIAIITFVTNQRSYTHLSLKNKDHYARRHGYDFIVDFEEHSQRDLTYWKWEMTERLIKTGKWDWLWWMDFDTLITNTNIKLSDIIEETLKGTPNADDIDFLVTHDCNGLNTGSYIVRAHERSLSFLTQIYTLYSKNKESSTQIGEQDAAAQILATSKETLDRTVQVPQWKLNAFPEEISCFDETGQVWTHGTFVLHFAGAWAHVEGEDPTGQLMNKYEKEIMWGDWREFY